MDWDEAQVNEQVKKEQGRYQTISTEQDWSIKNLLYGQKQDFHLRDQSGKSRAANMGLSWLFG